MRILIRVKRQSDAMRGSDVLTFYFLSWYAQIVSNFYPKNDTCFLYHRADAVFN